MATSKEYLAFVLDKLAGIEGVAHRAMMGEYVIYYQGKVVGGIYNNSFLVKPVDAAVALMPEAVYKVPYSGAKKMLLVSNLDDREFLAKLLKAMYDELPQPKPKKPRK